MITKKQIHEIKNQTYSGYTYLDSYVKGKCLYKGDLWAVFQTNETEAKIDEQLDYLCFNIYAQIVDTYTNLAFYEKPKITFENPKNQEWFDTYANGEFYQKLSQLFKIMCYAGDSVCYLNYTEEEKVEIVVLPNIRWVPLYDQDRPDLEAYTHLIEFIYKEEDKQEITIYQYFNKDSVGYIAFLDDNQIPVPAGFLDLENIKDFKLLEDGLTWGRQIETPLFFRFINNPDVGQYFGCSDFTKSILAKGKAINKHLNSDDYVLTKTKDPILVLDEELIQSTIKSLNGEDTRNDTADALGLSEGEKKLFSANYTTSQKGNTGKNNYNFKSTSLQETIVANRLVRDSKIVPASKEGMDPKYISHEANTDKSEKFIDLLKGMIYKEAKISPILFEADFKVGSLSGVALQRLIQETLHKVHTKELLFESVLKKLIQSILILENLTPEEPTIEWYDGIIDNRMEKIEEAERLLMNEMITKKEAIKMVMGVTDEQAQATLDEIESEKGFVNMIEAQVNGGDPEQETENPE